MGAPVRALPRNVLIALDQLANACLGGWPDETLSCRAYRLHRQTRMWALTCRGINALFFWQPDHCRAAFESEQTRRHLPPTLRTPAEGRD